MSQLNDGIYDEIFHPKVSMVIPIQIYSHLPAHTTHRNSSQYKS